MTWRVGVRGDGAQPRLWGENSRLRGMTGQGGGRQGVGSRFRGNDGGRGVGRRGGAPSVALARRMDSCLRRNDGDRGVGSTVIGAGSKTRGGFSYASSASAMARALAMVSFACQSSTTSKKRPCSIRSPSKA